MGKGDVMNHRVRRRRLASQVQQSSSTDFQQKSSKIQLAAQPRAAWDGRLAWECGLPPGERRTALSAARDRYAPHRPPAHAHTHTHTRHNTPFHGGRPCATVVWPPWCALALTGCGPTCRPETCPSSGRPRVRCACSFSHDPSKAHPSRVCLAVPGQQRASCSDLPPRSRWLAGYSLPAISAAVQLNDIIETGTCAALERFRRAEHCVWEGAWACRCMPPMLCLNGLSNRWPCLMITQCHLESKTCAQCKT